MKYLKLYKRWKRSGKTDFDNGMCSLFHGQPEWELICPTDDRYNNGDVLCAYWGTGLTEIEFKQVTSMDFFYSELTPLRENLVLLMAAVKGEL